MKKFISKVTISSEVIFTVGTILVFLNILSCGRPLSASFTASPEQGKAPLDVKLDATKSTGKITMYTWDFGDGQSGSGLKTSHTYNTAGNPQVALTVTDKKGKKKTATKAIVVLSGNQPPVAAFTFSPSTGDAPLSVTFNASASSDSDGSIVSYQWDFGDGQKGTGKIVAHRYESAGEYTLHLLVTDNDGAQHSSSQVLRVSGTILPPDPATVAPAVDQTVVTDFASATEFLYTGTNPIQTGVSHGTMDARRVAVLRGKVLTRMGEPLSGVEITILDHPEYGKTFSRADGMFDLAVNGGGITTCIYKKDGFLPVHRQENIPWKDYVWLDDVVLIPYDSSVATIDLTAPVAMQVAQGSVSNDRDGERQPTLLIPQGTKAEMMMADGSTKPINNLQIRLTEYTVGENGPLSMPAPLPPTTGYTYAVELSVDEVVQNGTKLNGKDLLLNQPIYHYVENFLDFPVGTVVPVGYYDNNKAAWIPSKNGRVIKIQSIVGGLANLELDSTGLPATVEQYASLDINDEERLRLSELYQPGKSLWRVPITHFSTWDCNWSHRPPDDAVPPNQPDPELENDEDEDETLCGSIIEITNQILGENIAISGTPFNLHYQSDRVLGRKVANTLSISLSGAKVPKSLNSIDLEILIAGNTIKRSFPAAPNQKTTFSWNGLDAYGRKLQGGQKVQVRIGYVYPTVYARPFPAGFAFAAPTGIPITEGRGDITIWQDWRGVIKQWDERETGLGGWHLNVHHRYDPHEKVIHYGNGKRQSASSLNFNTIKTVAGNGEGLSGDGLKALQSGLLYPKDIAVASDGTLYINESGWRIRRVGSDGMVYTIAGTAPYDLAAPTADSFPAAKTLLYPRGIALGTDGSLYFSEGQKVRRIYPGLDGKITGANDEIVVTVAGTGNVGYSGDGGPAKDADLMSATDVTIGPDGSLYILDGPTVRQITPNGLIRTVAGKGQPGGFSGDGGPAINAYLAGPTALDIGSDGSIYIVCTDNFGSSRVRRVGPDGIIHTIAGNGKNCENPAPLPCGDGEHASNAQFYHLHGVAVGADGSIYISDKTGHRIRKILPDGIITTLIDAGDISLGGVFSGDGGPALKGRLNLPEGLAIGPGGELFIADTYNLRIRKITSPFPESSLGDVVLSDEYGTEVFVFNSEGKHKKTLNALTGATLYQFTYDNDGYLSEITDAEGNATSIQRDTAGIPLSITGPFGHVTKLELNADGYLSVVTNPAGETHTFGYGQEGLLTRFTNPRNFITTFSYDTLGRLFREDNAAGGFLTLSRTKTDSTYAVEHTSSLGRETLHQITNLRSGDQKRRKKLPSLLLSESFIGIDGSQSGVAPDGTKLSTSRGSDPRWGMLAPVATETTLSTPHGLKSTFSFSRAATLLNPENPFSMTELRDTANINGRIYTSQYNAVSRTITQKSPLGKKSSATIDSLGRLTQTEIEGIMPVRFSYDSRGRLDTITQGSGTDMRRTIFGYNNQGFLEKVTNPLDQTVIFEHDKVGRIKKQTMPDGRVIGYTYDANGNLASLTPPGKPAHSFSYSPIDQVTQYTPPDVVAGRDETQYTYNTDRELTEIIRPDGDTVKLDYSEGGSCNCGRLSAMTIRRGKIEYDYNNTTGNLESINAPGGIGLSYTYDGALLTGKTWSGAIAGKVSYSYDNDFRPVAISLNGQDTITYQYDDDGLLFQAGSLTLRRNTQNGLLAGSTLGNVTDSITYNDFGEMTGYKAMHGNASLYNFQFTRDKLGRITQKIEAVSGTVDTFNYDYDLAGRLTEVKKNSAKFAAYTYDDNGNRLTYTDLNGTVNGTYDAQDRLQQYGNARYEYTANGELKYKIEASDTTTYLYDELGNLIEVILPEGKKITYLIDGQNRRIGKKVKGTLVQGFLYEDHLRPIAELDSNGNIFSRFVYATHVNVPEYMINGGVTYRIITDHLGSPRLVINAVTGKIAQQISYDAYGNVIGNSNQAFLPFGFAGGLYDSDTKMVRFGARDYDAWMGRWTLKDPIKFGSKSLNFYCHTDNDPVNRIDLYGLDFLSLTKAQRDVIEKLKRNPTIGEYVKEFDTNRKFKIIIKSEPGNPNAHARHPLHSEGAICPASVNYSLKNSQDVLKEAFGLETTLENVIAHELGHIYYEHYTKVEQQTKEGNNNEAVRWENATRPPQAQRPKHD